MSKNLIENCNAYIEGYSSGDSMIKFIDKTVYKTIDNAIAVKEDIIKRFETDFGFNPNKKPIDNFDRNYAFTYGLLNRLKDYKNEGQHS